MTDTIFNDENFIQAELPQPPQEQTPAQAPDEPKKRGRKPGGKNRPKEQQQQTPDQPAPAPAPNQRSIFDEIADDVKKNQQQQTQTGAAAPAPAPIENLIDGYTVLLVMDIVIPGAIKFLFSKKFKGVDIAKIQMSKTQKESIEPLADKFAAYVQGYINPLYAFFIISSLMYYQNATDQLNKIENGK